MNVMLRPGMTKQEFLAWEEYQELRHEFDGHRIVPMVGATQAHELIVANIVIALGIRLRGGPCRVFGSGMKIEAAGSIRHPDVTVASGPLQPDELLLGHPVVVFEVESRSTARLDRTVKNREYEATPSILRYVMLSQRNMAATVFARADGTWTEVAAAGPVLAMPEIRVEVPLAEFYEGVATGVARGSRYRRR